MPATEFRRSKKLIGKATNEKVAALQISSLIGQSLLFAISE